MKNNRNINIEEIIEILNNHSDDTKVYIGCDSIRKKKGKRKLAKYLTVVVIHLNSANGCMIFSETSYEDDYDKFKNRPSMRLMNEVYKVSELYLKISSHIIHDIEIHLDINKDEKHGSSCVVNEAMGYIKGVCGVQPKIKPEAWAASCAADKLVK